MTTFISYAFEDETAAESGKRPAIRIDGPAVLPKIGEHVHAPHFWRDEDPVRVSGTLLRRSFRYEPNEVHIRLTLQDHYLRS